MEKAERTEAQKEASRRNGANSTGARTPEGRARSAQNATKHGLYSSKTVLANESQEDFNNLYLEYCDEFQPVGRAEYDLIQDMAVARWKIIRTENTVTSAIDTDMFIHQKSFDECFQPNDPSMRHHDACAALHQGAPGLHEFYERSIARFHRAYTRARNDLDRLQTRRLGRPPQRNVHPEPEPPPQPIDRPEVTENVRNEPETPLVRQTPPPQLGKTYREPETFTRTCGVEPSKLAPYQPYNPPNSDPTLNWLATQRR